MWGVKQKVKRFFDGRMARSFHFNTQDLPHKDFAIPSPW